MLAVALAGGAQDYLEDRHPESADFPSSMRVASGASDNGDIPMITALTLEEAAGVSAPMYVVDSRADAQPAVEYCYLYGSTEREALIKFNLPSDCASYRVAFVPYESQAEVESTYKNYFNYLFAKDYQYRTTTYPASKPVISIKFTKPYRYTLAYMKLDAAGNPFVDSSTGNYYCSYMSIWSNYQGAYEWRSLGTGVLTENISHRGVDQSTLEFNEYDALVGATPFTYNVEVEERVDKPGMFRVKNPFGPGHPNYDNFVHYVDKVYGDSQYLSVSGDDYYLIFDATDPSRVKVDYSMSGFALYMIFSGPRNLKGWDKWSNKKIDKYEAAQWGKFYDNMIVMPRNSMWINHKQYGYVGISVNDITLKLPGYVNYDFDYDYIEDDDYYSSGSGVTIKNIAPSIKSFHCALIHEDEANPNRFFGEKLYERVINREEGLIIKEYPVTNGRELTVNVTDFGVAPGRYNLVMVPQDADGNFHRGKTSEWLVNRKTDETKWKHIATGIFEETIMTSFYNAMGDNIEPYRSEVEIYEYADMPGYYVLKKPYRNFTLSLGDFYYSSEDFFVDATNPEAVTLNGRYLSGRYDGGGYSSGIYLKDDEGVGIGKMFGMMYADRMYEMWYMEEWHPEDYSSLAGKLKDGVITFPGDAFYLNHNNQRIYGTMKISLSQAGVEEVAAGEDAGGPAIYYNLQGVRVDNPRRGLYVRKQGGATGVVRLD